MSNQDPRQGEPTEGLGEYVEDQLNYAGDTGEYAVANDELQRTMDEIAALEHERAGPSPRADIDRALSDARSRLDSLRQASGATADATAQGMPMDYDRVAPRNEARAQVMQGLDENSDQSEL